ncbi:hypothetical protein CE91St57_06050 [Lachnospiraceae bacterium]|nr:hypothetical protein CE91St57_06050 [Lachnospiraceae bacterium]
MAKGSSTSVAASVSSTTSRIPSFHSSIFKRVLSLITGVICPPPILVAIHGHIVPALPSPALCPAVPPSRKDSCKGRYKHAGP